MQIAIVRPLWIFEGKSENLVFYQIYDIFYLHLIFSKNMHRLLVIPFVIKRYARNIVFKYLKISSLQIVATS